MFFNKRIADSYPWVYVSVFHAKIETYLVVLTLAGQCGNPRILAHTMICGGEQTSEKKFPLLLLRADVDDRIHRHKKHKTHLAKTSLEIRG